MPTYSIQAINIGTFALGEADKIITLFSAERGIVRAVAKGARKPGTKIAGKSEVLCVNKLLLATGRSLDIITQAESLESFSPVRNDLGRLSYCLYYAELTQVFGQGLADDSQRYFEMLRAAIRAQAAGRDDATVLCLTFEMSLLELLGYRPELTVCVTCREPVTEYRLSLFHHEFGGVICQNCVDKQRKVLVRERSASYRDDVEEDFGWTEPLESGGSHITPMVWKQLILAAAGSNAGSTSNSSSTGTASSNPAPLQAARRLMQTYIEHRAGKRLKALDLLNPPPQRAR